MLNSVAGQKLESLGLNLKSFSLEIFAVIDVNKPCNVTSSLTQSPLNIQQRNAAHKLFADAFFAAALEVGLDCRSGIQFPDLSSTSDIETASNFSSAHADACG